MIGMQEPDRLAVHQAAVDARSQLSAARALMLKVGYTPGRMYQLVCPTTGMVVETGYTYGESRLTVRTSDGRYAGEYRLNGRSTVEFDAFKQLASL